MGKGRGTAHRQAQRLIQSSHHLAMASHGTIMGLGRAQGCVTPDFDPCPAASAANSLPQPTFTELVQAPPGVPVQLQRCCLALPRGCREGGCCRKGCSSGVGLGATRGRGTMGGSHVSASQ